MPLYGKIVVIRRGGMDGTEFPLTAACLFGRDHGCDVRIQIPLVSKEHCRVEINENKEVVLTNLSSVNPTCINGVPVRQSERLKHGDVFTILDRSFRFEAPPPPTPKKKVSTPGKVLQQQPVQAEKRRSNSASDGSKIDNSMDQTAEAAKEMVTMETTKPTKGAHSPFHELCQIAKQELDPKSSWKTPQSKRNLQKPATPKASEQETSLAVEVKGSPKKMKAALPVTPAGKEKASVVTTTKKRRSSAGQPVKKLEPGPEDVALCPTAEKAAVEETPGQVMASATPDPLGEKTLLQSLKSPKTSESQSSAATPALQKKDQPQTPQKLSVMEVIQQIVPDLQSVKKPSETPKSPKRRSTSPKTDPAQPEVTGEAHSGPAEAPEEVKPSPRTSPRANAGQRFKLQDVPRTCGDNKPQSSKKRKSGGPDVVISTPLCKKKRVSFGGQLSPELFDKRLPPDCPLRRGATPDRRSLGVIQTPKSLLRRVTIGHIQSGPWASPRKQLDLITPSPKQHSSAKKKSPAKADAQTPKGRKSPSPAKAKAKSTPQAASKASATPDKSPCGATRSPRRSPSTVTVAKTPSAAPDTPSYSQTPTVKGRFSISRICTPSPVAEGEEAELVGSKSMTPKIPLKVLSMKTKARKTPRRSLVMAVMEMKRRQSGMFMGSWAQIVKYGKAKLQPGGASKLQPGTTAKMVRTKLTKAPAKQTTMTPAKRLMEHTSTQHANSPATIVVGRAQRRAAQIACGAPKVVSNVALTKLDMNMDEDLTGVLDLFETPANKKQRQRSKGKSLVPATPVSPTSMADLSLMKTPEETGEMLVSPLSVASTAKQSRYNSEAITCFLQDEQEASFVAEETSPIAKETISAGETSSQQEEASEASVTQTPKQKPKPAATCLTGVKRLMKTPKQKAEPVEDLRGKLLKTPRQPKAPQEVSLTGVKGMLKTPKHKATPVEDMVGIQRIMKTPRQKATPVEDMVGIQRIMKTPKQKATPVEDMVGIQRIMKTPRQKATPVEDMVGIQRIMKTPRVKSDSPVLSAEALRRVLETPEQKAGLHTPKQKEEAVEHPIGVQQLMATSKEKAESIEVTEPKEEETVQELVMMPMQQAAADVEDSEGLKELLTKPVEPEMQVPEGNLDEKKTFESVQVQKAPECNAEVLPKSLKELDIYTCTQEDKENVCPVEDIQANDTKPEAHEDDQSKRFVNLLKQMLEERITPVQVTVAPVHFEATKDPEQVGLGEAPPSSEIAAAAVAAATGDASEDLPEPLHQLVSYPARGRRRVDEYANTSQAGPVWAVRVATHLKNEERGRKAKMVLTEHAEVQMSELVVAAIQEESAAMPATTKTTRGRGGRQPKAMVETVAVPTAEYEVENNTPTPGTEEQSEPVVEASDEKQAQTIGAKSGRPRRMKRVPAQATEARADSDQSRTVAEAGENPQTGAVRSGRGRKNKQTPALESETTAETEPAAKSQRGKRARKAPAQATKADARADSDQSRTGAEAEENPQTGAVRSGRGRKNKQTPALESETTAETEPAAKSQCGKRARKAPAQATKAEARADSDQSQTVAEAEENPQTGAVRSGRGRKNKQTPALESETAETEPAAKSQRGKRATKAPAQATEAEARADSDQSRTVAEAEENLQTRALRSGRGHQNKQTPALESETTGTEPAAKSQRGKRARKAPAQATEAEARADSDQSRTVAEAEENLQTRAVRSGRGRKNKQTPALESETTGTEPAAKSQRGKRARKAPAQATEAEARADSDQSRTGAEAEENPQTGALRSGRGRKNKQTPALETETTGTEPAAKSQRGKRARKAPAQATEAEARADSDQSRTGAEAEENPQTGAVRSGRGRKNKQTPALESETTTEAEPAAKSQRGKRARKAPAQAIEAEARADSDQSRTGAEAEENPQTGALRSGRGRKNKQTPALETETTTETEPAAKSQRGKRARKAPAQATEAEARADSDQSRTGAEAEENPQTGAVQSGRGCKNKQMPAPESETTTGTEPVAKSQSGKRARKASAQATEAEARADSDQSRIVAGAEENPQTRVVQSGCGHKNKQTPALECETTATEPAVESQCGMWTRKAPAQATEAEARADSDQSQTVAEAEENPQTGVVQSGCGHKNKNPAPEIETTPENELVAKPVHTGAAEEQSQVMPMKSCCDGKMQGKTVAVSEPITTSQDSASESTNKRLGGRVTQKQKAKKSVQWSSYLEQFMEPAKPQNEEEGGRGPAPSVTDSTEEASVVKVQSGLQAGGAQEGQQARETTELAPTEEVTNPEDPKSVNKKPDGEAATGAVEPQPDKGVTVPAAKQEIKRKAGKEAGEPSPKKKLCVKPATAQMAKAPTATKEKGERPGMLENCAPRGSVCFNRRGSHGLQKAPNGVCQRRKNSG